MDGEASTLSSTQWINIRAVASGASRASRQIRLSDQGDLLLTYQTSLVVLIRRCEMSNDRV